MKKLFLSSVRSSFTLQFWSVQEIQMSQLYCIDVNPVAKLISLFLMNKKFPNTPSEYLPIT
jgi:hypothetical protein